VKFDLSEIRELIAILNKTDVTELELESEGFRLAIRKGGTTVTTVSTVPATNVVKTTPTQPGSNLIDIKAPMVGTFYRAASPEASPFVDINDPVRVGQSICIIEAMKLMNNIEAEVAGRVVDILVENGQPVEFGQVIMRLDPDLPL
jgi:acetyl-CoA carboxylase biotin carboxyl carrier protein